MWRVRSASVAIDEELSHHTPQGVAWWKNWDDKGNDLLLITTYGKGKAHIVGLDPKTNDKTVGMVDIKPKDDKEQQTHAGAIALYDREQEDGKNEGWVFIDGPKVKPVPVDRVWHTIRKYRLSDLRKAMTKKNGFVESVGEKKVYGASFMTIDGRHLYAGKWNPKRRDWMYSYTIHDDGSLSGDTKEDKKRLRWEVPRNTQGVAVADGRFLFSSSGGRKWRSNLYVTDKGETNLDRASVRCFRAPSMSQGITATPDGEAYLVFESGSYKYNGASGKRAINVIEGVHKTKLSALTSLPGGKIYLGTLHCKTQEDFFGDDEILIKVEDQKLKLKPKYVQISEDDKKGKKIGKRVQFTGKVSVKLYEKDEEGDDYLGKRVRKPGRKDGTMKFTEDDVDYRLSYKIR